MPRKTKKEANKQWSESKFWQYIRSTLRRAWMRFPKRYEALTDARRDYKGDNKKQKYEYQCNICKEWFKNKDVQVDHVIPAGSLNGYSDLPGFVERLFCNQLQILCSSCHKIKTLKERSKND